MKLKALLYCTKAKPYLYKTEDTTYPAYPIGYHTDKDLKLKLSNTNELANLNGKIVAECDFEVEKLEMISVYDEYDYDFDYHPYKTTLPQVLKSSCLTFDELCSHLKYNDGYAIHIKNLHIFDKPRELNKFTKDNTDAIDYAPSKMIHIWYYDKILEKWKRSIYVPVSSQELCRILNKEQTVLVRRNVLKEMLKNE